MVPGLICSSPEAPCRAEGRSNLDLSHMQVMPFDAQEEVYGDLVEKGIVDPTKVVRIALQDAASVAGLLITTEAMIAERPKKESQMPAMPGGGMGGMDY